MVPGKRALSITAVACLMMLGGCKVPAAEVTCDQCGEIQRIDKFVVNGDASPVGILAGAVIGGVIGNQIGGGRGKDVATAAGAVGGAAAGAELERRQNRAIQYEVLVALENGAQRTLTLLDVSGFGVGDRVQLVNGELRHTSS